MKEAVLKILNNGRVYITPSVIMLFSPWTHIVIYVRGMLSLLSAIIFQVLRRDLPRSLRWKRPGIDMDTVILHQDNAPSHRAEVTQLELDVMGFQQLAHSPYSPDPAPMDIEVFPQLK